MALDHVGWYAGRASSQQPGQFGVELLAGAENSARPGSAALSSNLAKTLCVSTLRRAMSVSNTSKLFIGLAMAWPFYGEDVAIWATANS
jgi:hypothetical protein